MKKVILGLSLGAFLLLTSCVGSQFVQVYDLEYLGMKTINDYPAFSNDECDVTYAFLWADGGDVSFVIKNKTDKDMYLHMSKSFFIRNGVAYDYYLDSEYTNTVATGLGATLSASESLYGTVYDNSNFYPGSASKVAAADYKLSTSKSMSVREPEFICIPANSMKVVQGFNISDYVFKDCDNKGFNRPLKKSVTLNYTKEDTPLTLRNRLAYAFSKSTDDVKIIDNEFYVSSVTNYADEENVTYNTIKLKGCESDDKEEYQVSLIRRKNNFYNSYSEGDSNNKSGIVLILTAVLGGVLFLVLGNL